MLEKLLNSCNIVFGTLVLAVLSTGALLIMIVCGVLLLPLMAYPAIKEFVRK